MDYIILHYICISMHVWKCVMQNVQDGAPLVSKIDLQVA